MTASRSRKGPQKSVAWRRFQRDARRGRVTNAHMMMALAEAVKEQADVLDDLAQPLDSTALRQLAKISRQVAHILKMHGLTHVGEEAKPLDDAMQVLVEGMPEAR